MESQPQWSLSSSLCSKEIPWWAAWTAVHLSRPQEGICALETGVRLRGTVTRGSYTAEEIGGRGVETGHKAGKTDSRLSLLP